MTNKITTIDTANDEYAGNIKTMIIICDHNDSDNNYNNDCAILDKV